MLNTSHWRWDRANPGIECLSLWFFFLARKIYDSGHSSLAVTFGYPDIHQKKELFLEQDTPG